MIKKLTLLLSAMLALLTLPALGFAAENQVVIDNGQLNNNRVLIPLRAVSENMGTTVEWDREPKTIKITNKDTQMLLAVNSKRVLVNQSKIDLDVPAELIKGTTYVPLRFVSQTLEANIDWNPKVKQATITLKGKSIVVKIEKSRVPSSRRVTDARLKLLSDKLNEAADSSNKQIQSNFKSYLTNRFIDTLISNKDLLLPKKTPFDAPVTSAYYTSSTTAMLSQSAATGYDIFEESHYILDRLTTLVYTGGVWKVDKVSTTSRKVPLNLWI
jgi:hypothetical protein